MKKNKYGGYVEVGGTAYKILFLIVYIFLIGFNIFIVVGSLNSTKKIDLIANNLDEKEKQFLNLRGKFEVFQTNIANQLVNKWSILDYQKQFNEQYNLLFYKNNPPLRVDWDDLLASPSKYKKKRIVPDDQIFIWGGQGKGYLGSAWSDKKGDLDLNYDIEIDLIVDYNGPNKNYLDKIVVSTAYTHPLVRITGILEQIQVSSPKKAKLFINVEKLSHTKQLTGTY